MGQMLHCLISMVQEAADELVELHQQLVRTPMVDVLFGGKALTLMG